MTNQNYKNKIEKGVIMKNDCPYCKSPVEARIAMAGGMLEVDGIVVRVEDTIHFWCEDCGDGVYVQK